MILFVLLLLFLGILAFWYFQLRPWPFGVDPSSLGGRLTASSLALQGYAERTEARLRLQLLAGEMDDGRRSEFLRPEIHLIEDLIDDIAATAGPEGATMQAHSDALLADLSRDRNSAREHLVSLIDLLRDPAGPGRQGATP